MAEQQQDPNIALDPPPSGVDPWMMGLLGAGASVLRNSGWRNTPITQGEMLGYAIPAGVNAYQQQAQMNARQQAQYQAYADQQAAAEQQALIDQQQAEAGQAQQLIDNNLAERRVAVDEGNLALKQSPADGQGVGVLGGIMALPDPEERMKWTALYKANPAKAKLAWEKRLIGETQGYTPLGSFGKGTPEAEKAIKWYNSRGLYLNPEAVGFNVDKSGMVKQFNQYGQDLGQLITQEQQNAFKVSQQEDQQYHALTMQANSQQEARNLQGDRFQNQADLQHNRQAHSDLQQKAGFKQQDKNAIYNMAEKMYQFDTQHALSLKGDERKQALHDLQVKKLGMEQQLSENLIKNFMGNGLEETLTGSSLNEREKKLVRNASEASPLEAQKLYTKYLNARPTDMLKISEDQRSAMGAPKDATGVKSVYNAKGEWVRDIFYKDGKQMYMPPIKNANTTLYGSEAEDLLLKNGWLQQDIDEWKTRDNNIISIKTNARGELASEPNQIELGKNFSKDDRNFIYKVSSDFQKDIPTRTAIESVAAYESIAAWAGEPDGKGGFIGSGTGDYAMIYAFVKALDPTSTVLAAEFANAKGAGLSGAEALDQVVRKLLTGEGMTPKKRAAILEAARKSAEVRTKAIQPRLTTIKNQIKSRFPDRYENVMKMIGVDPYRDAHARVQKLHNKAPAVVKEDRATLDVTEEEKAKMEDIIKISEDFSNGKQ